MNLGEVFPSSRGEPFLYKQYIKTVSAATTIIQASLPCSRGYQSIRKQMMLRAPDILFEDRRHVF